MIYTQAEKLQILLLCDIYETLGINKDYNTEFIKKAISTDNILAIGLEYPILSNGSELPAHVQLFTETVEMYITLRNAYSQMSFSDKMLVSNSIDYFDHATVLYFPGFDGNNEAEYISVGEIYTFMEYWPGAILTKNSHTQKAQKYRDMLAIYNPAIRKTMLNGELISVTDFINVMSV